MSAGGEAGGGGGSAKHHRLPGFAHFESSFAGRRDLSFKGGGADLSFKGSGSGPALGLDLSGSGEVTPLSGLDLSIVHGLDLTNTNYEVRITVSKTNYEVRITVSNTNDDVRTKVTSYKIRTTVKNRY